MSTNKFIGNDSIIINIISSSKNISRIVVVVVMVVVLSLASANFTHTHTHTSVIKVYEDLKVFLIEPQTNRCTDSLALSFKTLSVPLLGQILI